MFRMKEENVKKAEINLHNEHGILPKMDKKLGISNFKIRFMNLITTEALR